MRQRLARRALPIGLAGLALVAAPAPARADSEQVDVIAAAAGTALVFTGACAGLASMAGGETDEEDYARRGFLLALAGTWGIETFDPSGVSLSVDDSLGLNGGGGYRCHRHASAEVEVEWLDGFEGNATGGGASGPVRVEPVVVTTNVKGYWPMERYQPFLLFGVGAMTAETTSQTGATTSSRSDYDTALRFGTGIDVYATPHIVLDLGVDYVLPLGALEGLSYVSIGWGLQYRF
jgi:opacity protein-like surface antigen